MQDSFGELIVIVKLSAYNLTKSNRSEMYMLQDFVEEQKLVCEEFDSRYIKVNETDLVAIAKQTLSKEPIVGLRKQPDAENVSWFIYGGELEEGEDFFDVISVKELEEVFPDAIPYLALEQGFRFMIDADEYEDVWKADIL
ncbi:hypothetical protein F964_03349 [Acinetobacter guillouiae NIPH 991]|jgi:hypothetical protein|uniref:Imm33-like domain-containing protein n=2 Tax=Moraxellaceae TaxID=468 RepID=N8Y517_ACIGI|nr:hypothetical protein F964_03349 [Acinetobacter guillouiae NIPH 991]